MLESKRVVVTGTSRGIGLEMTRQLLERGARVFAAARTPERSEGLAALKARYAKELQLFTLDVRSDEQVARLAEALGKDPASIDVLINNAGIYGGDDSFETLSFEDVMETLRTNSVGPMRVTRALLPLLNKARDPKIVHITSLMGSISDNAGGGSYGYRMSKAALNMFNKSFAVDHPEVTSIVVHPGWVKTEMGGPRAPLAPADSVRGIVALLDKIAQKDSGKFFDYEGDEQEW